MKKLTPDMILAGLLRIATEGSNEGAKVRSFEVMGRALAMFKERVEISSASSEELLNDLERLDPALAATLRRDTEDATSH
jgi:hypothetical protein